MRVRVRVRGKVRPPIRRAEAWHPAATKPALRRSNCVRVRVGV